MTRGKNSSPKKVEKNGSKKKSEEIEKPAETEETEEFPPKIKEVVEIEEREDVVAPVDKLEADPLLDTSHSFDADSEELALDEEELDPFGDKWEA